MANISTKLVYLDLETILENYRNPKLWQKEWLIFKSKELEARWCITGIDVIDNKIKSCITLKLAKGSIVRGGKRFCLPWEFTSKSNGYFWYNSNQCRSIPIDNKEYSQEVFENNIFCTLIAMIKRVEEHMIHDTYEFKAAWNTEEEAKEKLKEIAENFLNEEKVTNDEIREAYIENYIRKNHDHKLSNKIVTNSQYHFFKTLYLHISSWFNNQEEFEKHAENLKQFSSKKYVFDIFKEKQKIETDEWVEEMKDQLEKI